MQSRMRRVQSSPARAARCAVLGALLAMAATAGCSPGRDVHGHVRDPEALTEIRPGVQTRDQVADLLGTPSAVATFDDARWYYITRRTETVAFYDPDLVSQHIVVIAFDEGGVVTEVTSFAAEDAREIDPVDDESPTRGRTLSLLEQLFGNLGRPARLGQ